MTINSKDEDFCSISNHIIEHQRSSPVNADSLATGFLFSTLGI
jgi:hypothetical protein